MVDTVFLVFPDQLFKALFTLPKTLRRCFVEDERYFRELKFHKHKLIFHRASMQAARERLLVKGFNVEYYDTIQMPHLTDVFEDLQKKGITTIHYYEITNKQVAAEVKELAKKYHFTCTVLSTPAFFLGVDTLQKAKLSFSAFYEKQRKHLNLLIEKGKPVGGKWELEAPIAKTLPKGEALPIVHIPEHNRYVEEAIEYVDKYFSKNIGSVDNFVFPVTYADAEDWLEDFILRRLSNMSLYRHIIMANESIIYHACIASFLNSGLLTPQQVLEAVLVYQRRYPLAPEVFEYFVRYLTGYREFSWAYYQMKKEKVSSEKAGIPEIFWTASTALNPVDTILNRVYTIGYCHNRERQLLAAAFMLLGGNKAGWYEWQRTVLLDVYDWTLAESLHHDPVMFTAEEIMTMSDFPSGPWVNKWKKLQYSYQKTDS